MVWRGLSGSELEAQYNLAQHPDRMLAYERYRAASIAARDSLEWREIAYGSHRRERMEFFPGKPNGPLLVFFHGGYWRALDKEMWSFVAAPFVAHGISVANVEYPLAPEVTLSTIVAGARRAMTAIHREARRAGIDLTRTVVGGHSAGGHLAAMLLGTDWTTAGLPGFHLAGGVPISGLFELEPLRHLVLNDILRMSQAEAAAMSAAPPAQPPLPRVIAAVGSDETPEFRRQSNDYAARWRAAGGEAETLHVADTNHFTVMAEFARPGAALFEATVALLMGSRVRTF